jgi:tRNA threonylcarbamoyladenosine biosynthesis protein TsaB
VTDPRLLILETSGRRGAVAVAQGERLLGVRALDEARRNARDLAPAISELLRGQGWTAKQLEAVVVSLGPGSYTGLRVGVMSAKTLAYATNCALLGIDTFAAVALQSPAECLRVDVVGDAQKEDVYVQSFARGEGWRPAGELRIEPFARWLEQRDTEAWVSGPGLAKWATRLPAGVRCAPVESREPAVESLLTLGLARYRAEERDDLFALEPLYLRASSAERQWRGRGP